jgi:hypothetical protein
MPKPLLPVVNKPIMEYVLALLKRHGLDEAVVTVQFLASLVRNYFGDGEELGMSLQYANEETPLGTAGSVKNAEEALRDDTFLVISGDALTDIDLTDLIQFHRDRGALVTVCLAGHQPARVRHHHHRRGRPGRSVPGEADLGRGVLRHRQHRHLRDGAGDLQPSRLARSSTGPVMFPALLAAGKPSTATWRMATGDVRYPRGLPAAQADVLSGLVRRTSTGSR